MSTPTLTGIRESTYLDKRFTVLEPSPGTIAELVALIGADVIIASAVDDLHYRNKSFRVYAKVSAELLLLPFPKRIAKTAKISGRDVPILVSDMDHIRDFLEEDEEDHAPILQALFQKHGCAEPIYVAPPERFTRATQAMLELADQIFADGPERILSVCAYVEAKLGGRKIPRGPDGLPTVEILAKALQANVNAVKRTAETTENLNQALSA